MFVYMTARIGLEAKKFHSVFETIFFRFSPGPALKICNAIEAMREELKQNWRRAPRKRVLFKLGTKLVGEIDVIGETNNNQEDSDKDLDSKTTISKPEKRATVYDEIEWLFRRVCGQWAIFWQLKNFDYYRKSKVDIWQIAKEIIYEQKQKPHEIELKANACTFLSKFSNTTEIKCEIQCWFCFHYIDGKNFNAKVPFKLFLRRNLCNCT